MLSLRELGLTGEPGVEDVLRKPVQRTVFVIGVCLELVFCLADNAQGEARIFLWFGSRHDEESRLAHFVLQCPLWRALSPIVSLNFVNKFLLTRPLETVVLPL